MQAVASGRTPYRPRRWEKGDGFWQTQREGAGGSADGFQRLGTNREILSWPGIEPQVRTEADEETAQNLLKRERDALRASLMVRQAMVTKAAKEKKARENREFATRQQERRAAHMVAQWTDDEDRRKFALRQMKLEGLSEVHTRLSSATSFTGLSEAAACSDPNPASSSNSTLKHSSMRRAHSLGDLRADRSKTFTLTPKMQSEGGSWGVDASPRLPAAEYASWQVRIDQCHDDVGNVLIGVCDIWRGQPATRCCWGLDPSDMTLYRMVYGAPDEHAGGVPEGFPDGHLTPVGGPEHSLRGRASGSVIEVIMDYAGADGKGTLSFHLGGVSGPIVALSGFPRNAELRPWTALCNAGDQVTLGTDLRPWVALSNAGDQVSCL